MPLYDLWVYGLAILIIPGVICVYLMPTIYGWKTKHNKGILIANLVFGFTIVGWVLCLIWAAVAPKNEEINVHSQG